MGFFSQKWHLHENILILGIINFKMAPPQEYVDIKDHKFYQLKSTQIRAK